VDATWLRSAGMGGWLRSVSSDLRHFEVPLILTHRIGFTQTKVLGGY
jgi:hypothetical protein